MPRPRSFDPTEALQKAMRVFWAKGYDATSMVDLMEAMELHKGSIYQAFGDKHDLFKAALSLYMQSGAAAIRHAVEQAETPFEAVKAFMESAIRQCVTAEDACGCFMMNSAVELSTRDEGDTSRIPPGGTPGYVVFDLRGGYQVSESLSLHAALENILDEDYRIHGSGQNMPGRNVIFSVAWRP